MMKIGFLTAAITAVLLTGCAIPMTSPAPFTKEPLSQYDKDTDYAITQRDGGYTVVVNYSRYQFIPESTVVAQSCMSMLLSIAHEHAEKTKRPIKQINEQRVAISTGRNGFTGITSCAASVPVDWL